MNTRKKRVSTRKQPIQSRSKDTVSAILKGATRVLTLEGMTGFNTNRIAEITGLSVGSLYQYFPNKEAVLAALINHHMDTKLKVIREEIERNLHTMTLKEAVRALIQSLLKASSVNSKLERAIFEHIPKVMGMQRFKDTDKVVLPLLKSFFELRKEQIRPENLELASFILVQSVRGVIYASKSGQSPSEFSEKELTDELTELVTRYLSK